MDAYIAHSRLRHLGCVITQVDVVLLGYVQPILGRRPSHPFYVLGRSGTETIYNPEAWWHKTLQTTNKLKFLLQMFCATIFSVGSSSNCHSSELTAWSFRFLNSFTLTFDCARRRHVVVCKKESWDCRIYTQRPRKCIVLNSCWPCLIKFWLPCKG